MAQDTIPMTPSALTYESDFRRHFETHYAALDVPYESLAHAYRLGFQAANDPKFLGQPFHDVEPAIRAEYSNLYPGGDWDRAWDAVFYGWEKAGGAAGGFGFI